MREIKFRGKRVDNGEWVYGCFVEDGFCYICSHNEDDFLEWHLIDTDTIGQFTGLTDRNGKEIYEHDIVRYCDDIDDELAVAIVIWHPDACSFCVDHPHTELVALNTVWEFEVIGNIYDTPEHLKSE